MPLASEPFTQSVVATVNRKSLLALGNSQKKSNHAHPNEVSSRKKAKEISLT
jgi:hypothetical protein